MSIRVGTLVTRYSHLDRDNPCLSHINWDIDDHPGGLDVCLGMVIECISGVDEVIVNWVQMCPYAKREGQIAQEGVDHNLLWEVGQILS